MIEPASGDDRVEFAAFRREIGAAMAADHDLRRRALEVSIDADRYGYSYQWTWLGLPIIQMPPDVLALQEVIWADRPQLIIETGVARGGSVIFEASILQLLGEGRVCAIDIDIRSHNRDALEHHPLASRIDLIEGSSTDPAVLERVRGMAGAVDRVMVILDSDHTHEHVLAELRAYAPLVSRGQHLVVADTAIEDIPVQTHRVRSWGPGNSPKSALIEYVKGHPEFEVDEEIDNKLLLTSSPGGYLRRR